MKLLPIMKHIFIMRRNDNNDNEMRPVNESEVKEEDTV